MSCVCVCVFMGGRKKGTDLVVRGLCPQFVVQLSIVFFVTVSLYRIKYQISLSCIMVAQMY